MASSIKEAMPNSKPGIELYSGKYFAACGLGGIIGKSACLKEYRLCALLN